MKKVVFFLSILIASSFFVSAQSGPRVFVDIQVIMGNKPPAPNEAQLMRAEEARHPNIAKAMHDLEDGLKHLHEAPDDFGGHKGQAESDMRQAWVSLRKALYFRIYEDRH